MSDKDDDDFGTPSRKRKLDRDEEEDDDVNDDDYSAFVEPEPKKPRFIDWTDEEIGVMKVARTLFCIVTAASDFCCFVVHQVEQLSTELRKRGFPGMIDLFILFCF